VLVTSRYIGYRYIKSYTQYHEGIKSTEQITHFHNIIKLKKILEMPPPNGKYDVNIFRCIFC
jgi:hypothetical protein